MDRRETVLVGVGGFAGAVGRHAVAVVLPSAFPWGTLAVNVGGAFALGLFVFGTGDFRRVPDPVRLVVATGFLASFTTYSTFAAETVALSPAVAAANVTANYALGGLAVGLARWVVLWRS
jgi:CrcB protein